MFKNISLSWRIITSFLSVVLGVALIGWMGISRLNKHIQTFGYNTVPSISGLWKINEGQTQILAAERNFLNPNLTEEERRETLNRIQSAWEQINEGFKIYEPTPKNDEEAQAYQAFLQDWQRWKQSHEQYMALEAEYYQFLNQNPTALAERATRQTGLEFQARLDQQEAVKQAAFNRATQSILEVLQINEAVGELTKQAAFNDVNRITILMLASLIIGPIIAILVGQALSRGITKPIFDSINLIASSSSQIAAALEEQERILAQQASSVNETTSVMDELDASSRQATEQAQSAAENASHIFQLSQNGRQIVGKTQAGITGVQQKVEAITDKIVGLNYQISQVNTIINLVTNLANQTNMLALNASVEAVRAGEAGKGFAVVATEIRKLADESKMSAEKIRFLLDEIQRSINATVLTTDEGKRNSDEGIQLSRQTTEAFQSMADAIHDIMIINQQIALTAQQQARAVEQVVTAMNSVNQGARESVLGVSQARRSIELLNEAAKTLKRLSGA